MQIVFNTFVLNVYNGNGCDFFFADHLQTIDNQKTRTTEI
jgi:hypothetical protein